MGFTTETVEPLPYNDDWLKAVVVVPVRTIDHTEPPKGRAHDECVELCRANDYAVEKVLLDVGPRDRFDRPTMRTVMSLLTRTRPDIVVIYTWEQIGRNRHDRDRFTSSMEALGIRIHSVHNAGAPHIDWDSDDHTRPRTHQAAAPQ